MRVVGMFVCLAIGSRLNACTPLNRCTLQARKRCPSPRRQVFWHTFMRADIIYDYLKDVFGWRPESKAETALPAPLAGLAVPLSVAWRGQRCQRDGTALCATLDQHQPSHVHSTQRAPGHTRPHAPSAIHAALSYLPFAFITFSLYLFNRFVCVCVCGRCVCMLADWRCPLCHL